ncbi:hypothetical protein N7463_007296 [Penicillium fimorum]|uniref:Cysteine-rich secreted protein n=1 Tax=Penicillium fimorum TaxID=1882269 RepID=A0A9W9XW03_9EURO|nr:hypothetical protein N7463_007296 [Penicillium fimorum]
MRAKTIISTFLFQASLIGAQGVPVRKLPGEFDIDGNTIIFEGTDGFDSMMRCSGNTVIQLTPDKKFVACCLDGQHLTGDEKTGFDCCADDHDRVGSAATGYHCCPKGQIFDGQVCKAEEKKEEETCANGKILVNGKCACPPGTKEIEDGTCEKEECSSGLETGKCYEFTAENGERLVFAGAWGYAVGPETKARRSGKFRFCKDKECAAGQPINPSDMFYMQDVHGHPRTGTRPNQWLNNAANGRHIGKTNDFSKAGKFSVSKWPCGKYCLSGFSAGLGIACPAADPSMSFYENDTQACMRFEITEIPCDIRKDENNCIWNNSPDQCCGGKVDCSAAKL